MVTERVVYLLGAGFSYPLGLPLVGNFYSKSQQMFYETDGRNGKYGHFDEVFRTLQEMAWTKNFFNADLFNIEEVLSILEMDEFTQGQLHRGQDVTQYIIDVIRHYTPEIMPPGDGYTLPGNWGAALFGHGRLWSAYAHFVSALFQARFERTGNTNKVSEIKVTIPPRTVAYSVVTLNYDIVPEIVTDYCRQNFDADKELKFRKQGGGNIWDEPSRVWMAKLHGCVETGVIVPPTWNKGQNRTVSEAWTLAQELLSGATQIRIIGYSLPVADAYIKFLLKRAGIENRRLKKIDVICLDPDGSVKQRYDDFLCFRDYRFTNAKTEQYLAHHDAQYNLGNVNIADLTFDCLEAAHAGFMAKPDRYDIS